MNPKDLNYKMPPEWERHERTFISWPVQDSMVYPDDFEKVRDGYIELVRGIAEFEPVTIIVNPQDEAQVKEFFQQEKNVDFLTIEHNDAWFRDNGPTFLKNPNGEVAGVNWKFNAWGGKYAPWDKDDEVAPKVLNHYKIKRFDAPLIMEGGSFHVDGEGTLITTEECLLNPNRNPELSREEIEQYLKDYLNVEKIVWLKNGLAGDETDGHVDNVACFAAPGKIVMQVCDDPEDENYQITKENLEILNNATDAKGREFEIISIVQPPKVEHEGKRLTLSYLNFYFVNDGIILPVFGGTATETDKLAKNVLQETFPDRRIKTIDGMAVIKEGGNVHCTTQQMVAK
ncbi:agmatine deiminase [Evansella vedderi]|uniref:Putative agmatine deiminase n=1 Tax=Evansella vedderi TaxID=38282 RepID=A0ABU0A0I3_9BACI|nr:agmatine deiminase family protein [Evansella vedderi]MDQ0256997.1 agmatine deiminase [Evansella vedderi]